MAVDSLLADEGIDGIQMGDDILWPLADQLNSSRDIVRYTTGTDTVSVANHLTYDAFGNVTSETSSQESDDTAFHHTGKTFDEHTSLQWHQYRWYDASTGRWISEDPIGFAAEDVNLYRYVGNRVLWRIDPRGLQTRGEIEQPGEPSTPDPISGVIGKDPFDPGLSPPVVEIITDPGEVLAGIWDDIILEGIEGGWIDNMPDWGFTAGDEIQFAYGSHRWEVETQCCGTDNFGYCASTEFHSKGSLDCVYALHHNLAEVSGPGYDAFVTIDGQLGGALEYQLDAQANQEISPGGFSSSSDVQCSTNTRFESSLKIGGSLLIGDLEYDGFSAVVDALLSGNANANGADWEYEAGFGFLYQSPFGSGSIQLGGQCRLRGDEEGSSVIGEGAVIITF